MENNYQLNTNQVPFTHFAPQPQTVVPQAIEISYQLNTNHIQFPNIVTRPHDIENKAMENNQSNTNQGPLTSFVPQPQNHVIQLNGNTNYRLFPSPRSKT